MRAHGQTIGPLQWREVEEVCGDEIPADELQVAEYEGGPWMTAAEVLEKYPEVAQPPPLVIEPEEGLGPWMSQALRIITGDFWAFAGATFVALCMSVATFGTGAPAMYTGLCLMARRRFRGLPVKAGTVYEGMHYFLPALAAGLILSALIAVGAVGAFAARLATLPGPEAIAGAGALIVDFVVYLAFAAWCGAVGAAGFYAFPLIVSENAGGREALRRSWAVTRQRFASYFGMQLVLQIGAFIGLLAWGVGFLITAPLLPAAQTAAYEYHFRDGAAAKDR
jgi:hypothetical protein